MSQIPPPYGPHHADQPEADPFGTNPYAPSSASEHADGDPYEAAQAGSSTPWSAPSDSAPLGSASATGTGSAYEAGASYGAGSPDGAGAPYGSGVPYGADPQYGTGAPYGAASPYGAGSAGSAGAVQPGIPGYSTSPVVAPAQPSSGLALAAMVVGITSVTLSIICGFGALFAPVGVILSVLGMRDTASGEKTGRAFAITGLVTSILGCVALVLGILYIFFFVGLGIWGSATGY